MTDEMGSSELRKLAQSIPSPPNCTESSLIREYHGRTHERLGDHSKSKSGGADADPASTKLTGAKSENGCYGHENFDSAVSRERKSKKVYTTSNKQPRTRNQEVHDQALEHPGRHNSEKDQSLQCALRNYDRTTTDYFCCEDRRKIKRRLLVILYVLLLLVIICPVAVIKSKNHSSNEDVPNATSRSSIPKWASGGYLDPFDWLDTLDFNLTFTDVKVGGLYVMGLNSTWDDTARANENVPALNEKWEYGNMPIRGINLGGWLSIEPFITPSLFSAFPSSAGVVDEWTLSKALGPTQARHPVEKHYSEWVQESTFAEIQAAGFDHVRIPFSYWAVTTYDDDPYVLMVSWRYLLRGIEWARKYGLRINLDLHGAPGSQNGWNHSGHQGPIGWLNGTDGELNAQRTIEIHRQLSSFFSQPRYKNIITMYGLVNEPRMTFLPEQSVLTWSKAAIDEIRSSGYENFIVFGDGFLGLHNWHDQFQDIEGLVLDAHQYLIFDVTQLEWNHYQKIDFACVGWTELAEKSKDTVTGFGPTIFGEWSQADTDCAKYLNDVGVGSLWTGTLNMGDTPGGSISGSDLRPSCPTQNSKCSCTPANANPSSYPEEYKKWLLAFAEAQMYSFEVGWGWFYWTWKTENAPQWSYKDGLAAGTLPHLAYDRDWNCTMSIPPFGSSVLPEYY